MIAFTPCTKCEHLDLQDGIPISSELQYLIASSQQDLEASLGSENQNNHILVPPEAFEDHTVDVNCEL